MQIKEYRLAKGWSQEQLAAISGVSTRTVQRIETGQKPGLETLKSLAAAFETDVETLTKEPPMVDQNLSEKDSNLLGLKLHGRVMLIVLPVLVALNLIATPQEWWVHWVAVFWTLGYVLHVVTIRVMFGDEVRDKR